MHKQQYYILSLRWTHKDDLFFTFWRSKSDNYTYIKEDIGLYDEIINNQNVKSVLAFDDEIESLFCYYKVSDDIVKVLPNL